MVKMAVRPGVAPPRITTTAEMLLPQCQTLPYLHRKVVMTLFLKMRVCRVRNSRSCGRPPGRFYLRDTFCFLTASVGLKISWNNYIGKF